VCRITNDLDYTVFLGGGGGSSSSFQLSLEFGMRVHTSQIKLNNSNNQNISILA
jgi:hypothetical protein